MEVTVLWATETGRARACARRAVRLLRASVAATPSSSSSSSSASSSPAASSSRMVLRGMCSFDDFFSEGLLLLDPEKKNGDSGVNGDVDGNGGVNGGRRTRRFFLLFVSTTGDAEFPSAISTTWRTLLSKSLSPSALADVDFALFALGDRAYGPEAFCAAGRKLAARLAQLGAVPVCSVGYGDDGSPNGGVFADLDGWIGGELVPAARARMGLPPLSSWSSPSSPPASGPSSAGESSPGVDGPGGDFDPPIPEADLPYEVRIEERGASASSVASAKNVSTENRATSEEEWMMPEYSREYARHFAHSRPAGAYRYDRRGGRRRRRSEGGGGPPVDDDFPALGRVIANDRITAEDWMQDTRHLRIRVGGGGKLDDADNGAGGDSTVDANDFEDLPYAAGDVAVIMPSNPASLVDRFLSLLPPSVAGVADEVLRVTLRDSTSMSPVSHPWPGRCTLRGLLTHCADLQALPEREDLFALAACCHPLHPAGRDQSEKLAQLSDARGAALYGDYVVRERRNWVDVFYDFDSLGHEDKGGGRDGGGGGGEGTKGATALTISRLLSLLPSIKPRHFSIASSPSFSKLASSSSGRGGGGRCDDDGFDIELCVAIVEGTTPLGRQYKGCCSRFLSSIYPSRGGASSSSAPPPLRLWIRPGSFAGLPLEPSSLEEGGSFERPVMCVGAGTGVAPLRSLLLEREARRPPPPSSPSSAEAAKDSAPPAREPDAVLVFGCRGRAKDYYYRDEWEGMARGAGGLRIVNAFSRDGKHKMYVQRALREADGGDGDLVARHLLERGGALYVAGGSRMARAVREEVAEALAARLEGGERDAKKLLNRLKRAGLFSVEAWS